MRTDFFDQGDGKAGSDESHVLASIGDLLIACGVPDEVIGCWRAVGGFFMVYCKVCHASHHSSFSSCLVYLAHGNIVMSYTHSQ